MKFILSTTRIIPLIGLTTLLACQPSYAIDPCSENGNNWPTTKLDQGGPTHFILATAANGNPDMAKTDQLELANQDAENFVKVMREHLAPTVVICLLPNVSFDKFQSALKQLAKLVRAEDKVFIYFSGHGMTEANGDCEKGGNPAYCKETDCVDEGLVTFFKDGEVKRIRDKDFVELVNGIKTDKPITLFLDTCFAGGMVRGEKNTDTWFQDAKPKNFVKDGDMAHLPSRQCPLGRNFTQLEKSILYAASQEGQLAWEYKGQGGIFTHFFLQKLVELKTPTMKSLDDQFLDEVFEATANEVSTLTSKNSNYHQTPQRIIPQRGENEK